MTRSNVPTTSEAKNFGSQIYTNLACECRPGTDQGFNHTWGSHSEIIISCIILKSPGEMLVWLLELDVASQGSNDGDAHYDFRHRTAVQWLSSLNGSKRLQQVLAYRTSACPCFPAPGVEISCRRVSDSLMMIRAVKGLWWCILL